MNIVVTIPKDRIKQVEEEEADVARRIAAGEQGMCYYWTLPTLPRECPERIYFVWNGAVRAWHEVIQMVTDIPRNKIFMRPEIHSLSFPIPMRGFQGWRYFVQPSPLGEGRGEVNSELP
jgi:hypothetical protein